MEPTGPQKYRLLKKYAAYVLFKAPVLQPPPPKTEKVERSDRPLPLRVRKKMLAKVLRRKEVDLG